MAEILSLDRTATPIGALIVVADGEGRLCGAHFGEYEAALRRDLTRRHGEVELRPARDPGGLTSALARYFEGDLEAIAPLPVRTGGTAFQQAVWAELRRIPCGATVSYAELAGRIGRPSAVRAVGLANGSNPVAVVVPCHRVIGASGALTGYGGGLERKRWLLEHEGATARSPACR